MSEPTLHSTIWQETPEPDNPFATQVARCHGYDVYGQMLGQARWVDMVYLLLTGQAPAPLQARVLETLAVALANPGPRDPMVHAAMCAGIGGTPAAAGLMAALAVGAGQSGGARDVYLAMHAWQRARALPADAPLNQWLETLLAVHAPAWLGPRDAGWPTAEHPAGLDPHSPVTATIVRQSLALLSEAGPCTQRLHEHIDTLCAQAGMGLTLVAVAAAVMTDLGLSPAQGEMLHLLLRLPGAAAHALEQASQGFKRFPYPPVNLLDDPLHQGTTS